MTFQVCHCMILGYQVRAIMLCFFAADAFYKI